MEKSPPLAYRMRPENLDELVGQEHLIKPGMPLRRILEKGELPSSIILWGPPGCGKTTIARIISRITDSEFIELSAVRAGKKDIEKAVNKSRLFNKKTILFLDEIHRFNKAQQDLLLPFVENGTLTLIGATTENPSFEVISSLLSRSTVYMLKQLKEDDLIKIIDRALKSKKGLDNRFILNDDNKRLIANLANRDARSALNILEMVSTIAEKEITRDDIQNSVQKFLKYDKSGEEHYNIISALHKSMRDSDPDASAYWTMRMVEAGEDPKYIIRRMIRFASEDIGLADPNALVIATAAKQAVEFLGYPECSTALVQTAVYLANAPKSNRVYTTMLKCQKEIKETGNLPVPMHLRNAETKLMKEFGYGKGYKYAHDYKDAKVEQEHFPKDIKNKRLWREK